MTATYNNLRAVQEARYWADIRYHEGNNNSNVFASWQYGNAYNPWCDSFVSYCAYMGGYRFGAGTRARYACGVKGDYNVGTHHRNAVLDGTWRDRNYVAQPGDLVVFSWDVPDQHIEMVLSDQGHEQFATIGGNTSDAVMYRTRFRSNVVGFIALSQGGQTVDPTNTQVLGDVVKAGDRTDAVLTHTGGRIVLGADGGVFAYGGAPFYGSLPGAGVHLDLSKSWATSLLPTPDERGYWILGADGGVFSFGTSAKYHGNFVGQLPLSIAVQLVPDGHGGYAAIRGSDGKVLFPK